MKLNINLIALLAAVGTVAAAPIEKDRNDPVYRAELEKECGPLGVMDVPPGYKESEVRHCKEHPLSLEYPNHQHPDSKREVEKDRNDPVYRAELEKECGPLGVMDVPPGYKESEVRHCKEHPLSLEYPNHQHPDSKREVEKDRNDPVYRAELEKECGPLGVMDVPPGYKESEVRHCKEHPLSLEYPNHEHPYDGPTKGGESLRALWQTAQVLTSSQRSIRPTKQRRISSGVRVILDGRVTDRDGI
ncbi:hypothetical protein DE146DRAFT_631541 [Phaeosphaeria sp. MPI-PUGE-AT-0046c]|nr:hypothetical protein DE146DRAFT_631541 [Phaeosphaeria sp. MPI-PUGE-AT-0046c]